ncbi:MAG: NAD-dependent epimerase/dehydratase family protein [Nitrososphaerota archaeon]|nr:NAD-dependent epimerase/dehydratase family protein [Nitrososphaerota archaeon]
MTGAAGFIGANLVRTLLRQGRTDLRGVDNVSRGSNENIEGLGLEVVHADLRSYEQTLSALKGADCVFHLAARVGSLDYLHGSNNAELEALQSNLAIDANVFRVCVEKRVERVIYASSVSVYPIDRQYRLDTEFREEDVYPVNPEGGYGWAKLLGEKQLELMEQVKSGVARIFNAYGEYSEFERSAQVVPALLRKAIRYPKEDFIVWGNGKQTRNMLYISDCVDALLGIEKNARFPPLVTNIGNPHTVTVREIAETISKVCGKRLPMKFDASMPVGPLSRIPVINRAEKELGWKPTTSLETGISRTHEWMRNKILE